MKEYWTEQEFKNPPAWFRGAPFWAWNNKLCKEQLIRQIGYFKDMGMGGYHIHCRVGLDTEYLGEEFMDCVAACVQEGKKQGLYTYLYDEDRWPSGAAGGLVTKHEECRSRYLHFVPGVAGKIKEEERSIEAGKINEEARLIESEEAINGRLLAAYRIVLKGGCLASYEKVDSGASGEDIWRLYLKVADPSPWFNNQTYLDTLNKKAVERFIQITHESYARLLGNEFGNAIPSIFTDEPQFEHKKTLDYAEDRKSLILPYTDGFEEYYRNRYGEDFLEHFPVIVWELPDKGVSAARYQYHDGIAELFASSFADTIGNWCKDHNLCLTGHMMEEPTLLSQTSALGEAMRSYRSFQQPGIDMLCDWREYTTAKQAQSAAHQFGCPGVLSELYGVTNWDFDFRSHKLQGDWQAALGVTRRVHHLSWVSMEGEAKRDYPASIFYQSPWYLEYKAVEDHFARVNTALMRGKPHVRVGVIHPIESYWLHFGPREQTAQIRETLEQRFSDITSWLLFGTIDFDYLAESLLPLQNTHAENGSLSVGEMKYDAIIIPGCETLRSSTIQYLSEFARTGGAVMIAGDTPKYINATPDVDRRVPELAAMCVQIPFEKTAILNAIEFCREIEIRTPKGNLADQFLYQMRREGKTRWLFLANGKKPATHDIPAGIPYTIRILGSWNVQVCATQTGNVEKKQSLMQEEWTVIQQVLDNHDSLLLKLEPGNGLSEDNGQSLCKNELQIKDTLPVRHNPTELPQPEEFSLEEPNVLLLDQCEYRFNGGQWNQTEEILRIDNHLREKLGYPKRMEAWPQPWVQAEEQGSRNCIEMKFKIYSQTKCEKVSLALEDIDRKDIFWNGERVTGKEDGWFVDESLKKIPLGELKQGENQLVIAQEFGRKTNLEWCYLLGEFGVQTAGRNAYLTVMPRKLCFGDYTVQGLPFYAGNVKYSILVHTDEGNYRIQISKFRAPLLKVSVDGGQWQHIAYAPYEAELGYLKPGLHKIEILSYGNRINAFGPVHNCDETTEWFGPNEWRTLDEGYAYEYQLKRMGILKTPVIYRV